ncbi:hypothetical protein L345_05523, partial [Ophiophagus hannah]
CIGETREIDRRKEQAESSRGKGTAEGSLRETGRRGCRRRRERPGLELWHCCWRGLPGSCGFWGKHISILHELRKPSTISWPRPNCPLPTIYSTTIRPWSVSCLSAGAYRAISSWSTRLQWLPTIWMAECSTSRTSLCRWT